MKQFTHYSDNELFSYLNEDTVEQNIRERAFQELYSRLSPRIYAYCLRVLGDSDRAQDVFQDTFIRFYKSAQQEREMSNIPAFLLRIARNLCLNAKRNQHNHVEYQEYHAPRDIAPSLEKNELLDLITRSLDLLSHDYREVFVLREYDGLSYAEIGEIIGINEQTAKIRCFRAKNKIREILTPYLQDLSEE